jgi:hypothetical protein
MIIIASTGKETSFLWHGTGVGGFRKQGIGWGWILILVFV